MLFQKKSRKIVRFVWGILTVLIILSMVLFYMPVFINPAPTYSTPQQQAPRPTPIPTPEEPGTDFRVTVPE